MAQEAKVALITGAASGIGRGCVAHLLAAGWRVAALDADGPALDSLGAGGARLLRLTADVAEEAAVAAALAELRDRLGRLDLLVNNAGIAHPVSGPVEALDLADWNRWIGTNLTGVFLVAKHSVPLLRAGGGAIVNIASTRALQSEPDCEAYAAAKGGVVALTHAMAVSLGPDIRVNCVAPGWIDVRDHKPGADPATVARLADAAHAQHPAGRVGRPADIAEAVAYLAEASFVTGETLVVDGGMRRRMIYEA